MLSCLKLLELLQQFLTFWDRARLAGSLLGGFLFNSLGFGGGERYAGLIGSVIGALILLALYRMFVGRNRKLT